MFVELDITLGAFADIARPYLQETISRTPVTLQTTTDTLPTIRPFLVNSRGLFRDLEPGTRALADSADTIESALLVGTPGAAASRRSSTPSWRRRRRRCAPSTTTTTSAPGCAASPT